MIIDTHVHLWDKVTGFWEGRPTSNDLPNGKYRVGAGEYQMMPHSFADSKSTPQRLLAHLDAYGVEKAVVLQEWMDGSQDEYLAQVRRDYPRRLSVLSLLPLGVELDPAGYCETLKNLDFQGVLYSHRTVEKNPDFRLDDPRLGKIWHFLRENGLPLVLKLPPGPAIASQVEPVVNAFPGLKVVICHLGLPHNRGWLKQVALAAYPDVYLDTGGLTAFYRAENFPFPTARAAVRFAIQEIGAQKLMWGSDYPRTIVEFSYKQNLEWLKGYLSPIEQAMIFGEDAQTVYKW